MVRWLIAICAFVLANSVAADDATIHLPTVPVTEQPTDPEAPKPVDVLPADTWYVIESSEPLIVLASPVGLVSIEAETGPMKVRGKFADGNGKSETRTLSSKYLYTVEAVAKGKVELLIVPSGATESSDVIRQTLTVMGQGPQPPPIDPIPVDPVIPTPTVGLLKIVIIEETEVRGSLPPSQLSIFTSQILRDYVKTHCSKTNGTTPDFRLLDKDQDVSQGDEWLKQAFAEPRTTIPFLAVSNGTTGWKGPLPKTIEETMAILIKYGGN